jgi:hypothetical protein
MLLLGERLVGTRVEQCDLSRQIARIFSLSLRQPGRTNNRHAAVPTDARKSGPDVNSAAAIHSFSDRTGHVKIARPLCTAMRSPAAS